MIQCRSRQNLPAHTSTGFQFAVKRLHSWAGTRGLPVSATLRNSRDRIAADPARVIAFARVETDLIAVELTVLDHAHVAAGFYGSGDLLECLCQRELAIGEPPMPCHFRPHHPQESRAPSGSIFRHRESLVPPPSAHRKT